MSLARYTIALATINTYINVPALFLSLALFSLEEGFCGPLDTSCCICIESSAFCFFDSAKSDSVDLSRCLKEFKTCRRRRRRIVDADI